MEAITRSFILPVEPKVQPGLPVVYPWENTNLFVLCKQLFDLAIRTGYHGTFDEFKEHFGEYLESGDSIIEYDEYTGEYVITPLPYVDQILRTNHKFVKHDIVIEPIPYTEVSNEAGGTTVIIG